MPNNDDWIKSKLESIESKVDQIDSRVDNIDITLTRQSIILEDHTRRSLSNEQAVSLLKDQIQINKEEAQRDLKPIQTHVTQVHTVFKLIGIGASVFAILQGAMHTLDFIKTFFS